MSMHDRGFERDAILTAQEDLRHQISACLDGRRDAIASDAVAIFPYSGGEAVHADHCERVAELLIALLVTAIREGRLDARAGHVAALRQAAVERALGVGQLFTFTYLVERTSLDELALDDRIGAATEPWPIVAQLVRRASFELVAAYAERAVLEPADADVYDRLTTLHTRPMLDAVLAKEVERACRFGDPLSLILFDVDGLAELNATHGYGVGDRILERLGIQVRGYFRQHDWVARYADDSMAVLLTRTDAGHAGELADQVRASVAERLGFTDHVTERPVAVTISAGVVMIQVTSGTKIDPDRLRASAESALALAKAKGRNRVEVYPYSSS